MAIEKPLILIGAGRSGSTLLHSLLSRHPNAAWPTSAVNQLPTQPLVNRLLLGMNEIPGVERLSRRLASASEAYDFWEYYCPGFRHTYRDLQASDLTDRSARRTRQALESLTTRTRNRMVLKVTGWPRIGLLQKLLPDAQFVHIVRDGRAAVNSTIATDFWLGWQGPANWRWGPLSKRYQQIWQDHDESFVALAAIGWCILMDAVDVGKIQLNEDSYKEVKYEDLCERPTEIVSEICDFADLKTTPRFLSRVRDFSISSTNTKWRKDLSAEQYAIIEKVLEHHLSMRGYSSDSEGMLK